jgi:hypothetical protein
MRVPAPEAGRTRPDVLHRAASAKRDRAQAISEARAPVRGAQAKRADARAGA